MRHEHIDFYFLVTMLTITVKSQDIFSGKALALLCSLKRTTESFYSLKTLAIILRDCTNDELSDMPGALKHAREFVAFVKQLKPQVNSVQIEYEGEAEDQDTLSCRAFQQLLGGLYSGSESRHLTLVNSGLLLPATSSASLGLTKIDTIWDTCFDEAIEIICLHAATLTELSVACAQPTKIAKLLESIPGSSECLVYPNMRKLSLSSGNISRYVCKPFHHDYVPFPQLQSLSLDMVYPFSDDVLFRGNVTTLRYLYIASEPATIYTLNNSKTFDGKRFTNLRHVKVCAVYTNSSTDAATAELVIDFIIKIAGNAQTLEIEGR
ncbi:hypothetical protein GGI21_005209, partial [Coemansia aciculifera]